MYRAASKGGHTQADNQGPHSISFDGVLACLQSSKNGRAAVVSAGSNHNLLITRRGEIFAWGLSSSGELGQRDTPIDQAWPIQVSSCPQSRGPST